MTQRTLWIWASLPKAGQLDAWSPEHQDDAVENVQRLELSGHGGGSFDIIKSGCRPPFTVQHDLDLLEQISVLGKPNACVQVCQVVSPSSSTAGLITASRLSGLLKMSGFVHVGPAEEVTVDAATQADIREELKLNPTEAFQVVRMTCRLPNFQTGSFSLIPGASRAAAGQPNSEKARTWNLDVSDDDLIDPDSLLSDQDLQKPDPSSLRVCGSTGQRKACKDCTCGLREELEQGQEPATTKAVSSSCGSCYLGDAFRCASCPYLGMPAFKPGEKVRLDAGHFNADK